MKGNLTAEKAAHQAAQILDNVATMASSSRDTETLIATAKLWMNMVEVAEHLVISSDDASKVHTLIGFTRKEDENYGRIEQSATDNEN